MILKKRTYLAAGCPCPVLWQFCLLFGQLLNISLSFDAWTYNTSLCTFTVIAPFRIQSVYVRQCSDVQDIWDYEKYLVNEDMPNVVDVIKTSAHENKAGFNQPVSVCCRNADLTPVLHVNVSGRIPEGMEGKMKYVMGNC